MDVIALCGVLGRKCWARRLAVWEFSNAFARRWNMLYIFVASLG